VSLADDLERLAGLAGARGRVTGILAAEPASGRRAYLVAFDQDDDRRWLVLDADGAPLEEWALVREVAALVAMCELAGEVAGGGDIEELRAQLARVRMTEHPEGIERAEAAALELEHVLGSPPRLATPAYLDAIGEATRRLENALGEQESPFANAVAASSGAVEAFVDEVQARYLLPLR
jgi:hypothetical protein